MKSVFDKLLFGIVLLALLTGTHCSGSTRSGSTHQLTAAPTSVNFGSQALNNGTTQTITVGPFKTKGTFSYYVEVTGTCGLVRSSAVTVTVN